jgi:hypothetical protein
VFSFISCFSSATSNYPLSWFAVPHSRPLSKLLFAFFTLSCSLLPHFLPFTFPIPSPTPRRHRRARLYSLGVWARFGKPFAPLVAMRAMRTSLFFLSISRIGAVPDLSAARVFRFVILFGLSAFFLMLVLTW